MDDDGCDDDTTGSVVDCGDKIGVSLLIFPDSVLVGDVDGTVTSILFWYAVSSKVVGSSDDNVDNIVFGILFSKICFQDFKSVRIERLARFPI